MQMSPAISNHKGSRCKYRDPFLVPLCVCASVLTFRMPVVSNGVSGVMTLFQRCFDPCVPHPTAAPPCALSRPIFPDLLYLWASTGASPKKVRGERQDVRRPPSPLLSFYSSTGASPLHSLLAPRPRIILGRSGSSIEARGSICPSCVPIPPMHLLL